MTKKIELTPLEMIALRFPKNIKRSNQIAKDKKGEIWKPVMENVLVSNYGRMKKVVISKLGEQQHLLFMTQEYNGHLYVLYDRNVNQTKKLSRIVLQAFHPLKKGDRLYALHLDCNPLNCKLSNLQWKTLQEIHAHQKAKGYGWAKPRKTYLVPVVRRNGKPGHIRVAVSPKTVKEIRELDSMGINQNQISKLTGVKQPLVGRIINGHIRKDG